jgi:hypothetical protein
MTAMKKPLAQVFFADPSTAHEINNPHELSSASNYQKLFQ